MQFKTHHSNIPTFHSYWSLLLVEFLNEAAFIQLFHET
jgi:hypothetical protein